MNRPTVVHALDLIARQAQLGDLRDVAGLVNYIARAIEIGGERDIIEVLKDATTEAKEYLRERILGN